MAAVVLYHARVPWLPGGFLGVDIFFVLSGYLITSLLLAEYRRSRRLDLRRFWIGRARRLLPAALLVIVVCLVVEMLFLRTSLGTFRADAIASVFYVNNWHQILAGQSYFGTFGRPSLLEHYWSLSVEEQFYLVWPLVLAGGLAISRRRWVVCAAIVAAGTSAVLMDVLYHGGLDPSRVYYGTDTRAAPLMIGVLLAFAWPMGRMTGRIARGARLVLDSVGLAAVVTLVLVMHTWHDFNPFLYHGGFTIIAVLAALVIASAAHPASSLARLLAVPPLRWVGQRSYGIYLWHWPVIALTRPGIDLTWSSWVLVPAQIAATVTLASVSYRFVEMPVRRGHASRAIRSWLDRRHARRRMVTGAAAAVAAGTIAAGTLVPVAPARSPLHSLASASVRPTAIARHRPSVGTAAAPAPVRGRSSSSGGGQPFRTVPHGVQATIVSDSVGETIDEVPQALQALTRGLRLHLELRVCRRLVLTSCTYQGETPPSALRTIRSLGRGVGPLLIVDVGYDDDGSGYGSGINAIMRAAISQGVRRVVWLTLREVGTYASSYQAINAAIHQAAQRWTTLRIADWNAYSAGQPWFADGLHPNPAGAVVLARFLRSYITAASGGR